MEEKIKLFLISRILLFIWAITIAILSVIPYFSKIISMDKNISLSASRVDIHFIAFFIGTLLFYFSFRKKSLKFFICFGSLIFLYGFVIEIVQIFIPYRAFNPMDIIANALGCITFIIIWGIIVLFSKKKRSAL